MSASLLRTLAPPRYDVIAVWHGTAGAGLILGRASGPIPKSGSVRSASAPRASGLFKSFSWNPSDGQAVHFLIAIRLPSPLNGTGSGDLLLRGARANDRDLMIRPENICDDETFAQQLASLASDVAGPLTRFLLDLSRPATGVDTQRPSFPIESFLDRVALNEGCIELLLNVPGHFLLQGWSPPLAHDVEIVMVRPAFARHIAQVGAFKRADMIHPLTGAVFALSDGGALEIARAPEIFVLTSDRVLRQRLIDSRIREQTESLGQLLHLMPRLECSPTLGAALQNALRPRFTGSDTLNGLSRPVRAAVDVAVFDNEAGVFLSGWLFDPLSQVVTVELCNAKEVCRLDLVMTKITRPDVLESLEKTTTLPKSGRPEVGFAVSVSISATGSGALHIRFTFENGDVAFLPVRADDFSQAEVSAAVFNSVDLHKPSGIDVIRDQLGPFLARVTGAHPLATPVVYQTGHVVRPHGIVFSLATPCVPRVLVANFLSAPLTCDEQVIIVCGPGWNRSSLARLSEYLELYGITASIVSISYVPCLAGAIRVAAAVCEAEDFLALGEAVSCLDPGWRQRLRDAIGSMDAVCPTILYEDGSVRFRGVSAPRVLENAPFLRMQIPGQGMSIETINEIGAVAGDGGMLECCLVKRSALQMEKLSARFSTVFAQSVAFFASLRQGGGQIGWLPSVTVVAPETRRLNSTDTVRDLTEKWVLGKVLKDTSCAS